MTHKVSLDTIHHVLGTSPSRVHSRAPPSLRGLREGEEIMATMRESGGWWWGRMIKTHEEGWFPPTYVDLKEAE
eukprot:6183208-Amphidinium_carterae.2